MATELSKTHFDGRNERGSGFNRTTEVLLRNFTTSLRNNAHFRSVNSAFQTRKSKRQCNYPLRNQSLTLCRPVGDVFLKSGYPSALVIRYRRLS